MLLELLLHVIDVGIGCNCILHILVSKLELVSEALTKLVTDFISYIVVSENCCRGILLKALTAIDAFDILGTLQHQLVLLEHAILVLVDLRLNWLISMRLQHVIREERGVGAASVIHLTWDAAPDSKAHLCSQHTISVTHQFILLLQLFEHIALFIKHVFLLRLGILPLHEFAFL